jgi:adenylate cyclase
VKQFVSELRRRNVLKVAIAYCAIGWLVIELARIFFRILESPAGMVTLVESIVAIVFPFVVVVAWKFEMTPAGMKRTEHLTPNDSIPYWSRRKYVTLILGAAIIAAALRIYQSFRG